ncbi:MAG: helix-hairpin-helix domain-containing protein, partial [Nitrososphaerota archaeon]
MALREHKYRDIEELPGVGPATAEKLRELGFTTVESIATAAVSEIVAAGFSEKRALELISS